MTMGDKIKAARKELDMTQEQLGKLCNTTKQTIQRYESGITSNIPLDRVQALADALHVTPAYLMDWKEEPATAPIIKEITGIISGMSEEQLSQVSSYIKFIKSQG